MMGRQPHQFTWKKGVAEIASEMADLAAQARAGKLSPAAMSGASFTISSLGGIGGTGFTPIVNPPELAILGITRTETITVWNDGVPRPVPMVPLEPAAPAPLPPAGASIPTSAP